MEDNDETTRVAAIGRTATAPPPQRVILIPGNGSAAEDLSESMWYGWLAEKLRSELGVEIRTPGFPDPLYAREHIWKAFCRQELQLDENTIVVGHSSGAACALRLMEDQRFAGCILVSAYDTDFGDSVVNCGTDDVYARCCCALDRCRNESWF